MDKTLKNTPTSAAYQALLLGLCVWAYISGGIISSLVSTYLPLIVKDLLGEATETRLSEVGPYINAAFLFGMTLGGLTLGVLSDRIGRVRSLALSAAIAGIFTLLIAFAHDWQWLVVCRFFAGIGVSGILLIAAVFIAEVWMDKSRAIVQGILAVAFPVGIILTGSLNALLIGWRTAFFLGLMPLIAAFGIILFLKESTHWQDAQKAKKQPISTLFQGENRSKLIIGASVYGACLIGLWAVFAWLSTWATLLVGNAENAESVAGLEMIILGMGAILGSILSGFLINWFGLRATLLTTFAACFMLCCLLFLTNKMFSSIVYLETAILALFFGISQGALSVYITELFPTNIRATASGFCFNIGRVFTASSVFFVGTLVTILGGFGNSIFTFSLFFLVAFLVAFFNWKK